MSSTPPLIDSTIYFFSGAEVCRNLMPVLLRISVSCGIFRFVQTVVCAPAVTAQVLKKERKMMLVSIFPNFIALYCLPAFLVSETARDVFWRAPARPSDYKDGSAESEFRRRPD